MAHRSMSPGDEEDEQSEEIGRPARVGGRDGADEEADANELAKANILVAVRCRPMNEKEQSLSAKSVIATLESKIVVLVDPTEDNSHAFRHQVRLLQPLRPYRILFHTPLVYFFSKGSVVMLMMMIVCVRGCCVGMWV
jgi:hypothetical protein